MSKQKLLKDMERDFDRRQKRKKLKKKNNYIKDIPEMFAKNFLFWLGKKKMHTFQDFKKLFDEYMMGSHYHDSDKRKIAGVDVSELKILYPFMRRKVVDDNSERISRRYPDLSPEQVEQSATKVYDETLRGDFDTSAIQTQLSRRFESLKEVSSYTKDDGTRVGGYQRTPSRKFSSVESEFLRERIDIHNNLQLVQDFNATFPGRKRTYKSITGKKYRLRT